MRTPLFHIPAATLIYWDVSFGAIYEEQEVALAVLHCVDQLDDMT